MTIASQGIHIIHGDSAGGSFRQAFHDVPRLLDRVLIERDNLSSGPTPHCDSLERWCELRLTFWNGLDMASPRVSLSRYDPLRNVERLKSAEAIYLWIGTDVDDQLMVAYVLHLIDSLGGAPERISLVQFPGFDIEPRFPSIGMMNPKRIRSHPAAQSLTTEMIAGYREGWKALTSTTPCRLVDFCARDDCAVPYLREAARCLLRHYPDCRTGLGYWDRELLRLVADHGPSAARIIGHCISSNMDDPHHIGDFVLLHRLHALGHRRLPAPLLKLTGKQTTFGDTEARLTEFGQKVMEATASYHPVNPIDDWIGGVHLSSTEGRLWFLDNGKLIAQ